jgi:hypothetical protein
MLLNIKNASPSEGLALSIVDSGMCLHYTIFTQGSHDPSVWEG